MTDVVETPDGDLLISTTVEQQVVTEVVHETVITVDDHPTVVFSSPDEDTILTYKEVVNIITEGVQGPPGAGGDSTVYDQLADVTDDDVVYRAEAVPGTLESEPKWRIRKIEITYGPVLKADTTWANGSKEFVHLWGDRLLYNYSQLGA